MSSRLSIVLKQIAIALICTMAMLYSAHGQDGGVETISVKRMTGVVGVDTTTYALATGDTITTKYQVQIAGEQRKIFNVISLSLVEETTHYMGVDFTAAVQVRIDYGSSPSSYSSLTRTLEIDYKKDGGTKYNAKNYIHFLDAAYVRVEVLSISTTPSSIGSFDEEDVLLLQNEMRVTRYFTLDDNVEPLSFSQLGSTADGLSVTWEWPEDAGHNYTQLEWTWLETELENNYETGGGGINYDLLFKNNATRVDLVHGQDSYTIPLFYDGVGKLYYRIRAVNMKASGTRSDGPWSDVASYSFGGHDDSLNWQSRTSFAEEGKRKTVMEYYDGSLRSRQTVTKDNVNNTTVTAETLYDYEGRPAIQILPVPGINSVIKYQANLNLFNTQSLNQNPASIFDLQPINSVSSVTEPLTAAINSSGAAKYYSPGNDELGTEANDHIPDSEGFPYTVTRYTPDATGRIMAQSGVGKAHKMGSGRETKYYYGTAAQEELDGLFGTEVGNYTHYFKNMVKDANGQMSVSYVDMQGRTIATALAGESPANLMPLDISNAAHYPNQAGTTITRNLLDHNTNIEKGNTIEAINSLLVPFTTIYNFRYELQPQALQMPNCPGNSPATLCYDCMYDLEISITDESGETEPIILRKNNITLTPDENCSTPVTPFGGLGCTDNIFEFSYELQPGSYAIRKTLTLSESSLEKYKAMYLSKALCKTEQQLIDSIYSVLLSASGCNDLTPASCESCLETLGDSTHFRNKFLHSIGLDSTVQATATIEQEIRLAYATGLQQCQKLCTDTTSFLLPAKRQLMLADMMPYGGQYARSEPDPEAPGTTMFGKYNIFSTTYNGTTQPYYRKPWNPSKTLDFYRTATGSVDQQIHPGGSSYTQLNALTADEFTNRFVNNWAEALLPHHPEYDRLVYAETNLADAYNWITVYSKTQTYKQAHSAGYIFTASGNITDPFYSIAPTAYKDSMAKWVNSNYWGSGLSLWQIARGSVKCADIANSSARSACYTNGGVTVPPFADITTTLDSNRVWNIFRNLYMAARDYQVNNFIAAQVPLSDASSLIAEKFQLRFGTNNNVAAQYGWTWYPSSPGSGPSLPPSFPAGSVDSVYESRCHSYIQQWTQSLLQCDSLAARPDKNEILEAIMAGMEQVCIKGSDAANPYGSSTVSPSTPVDGSHRSFEEVIDSVFAARGINRSYYCNPYVIEYPKPYGQGLVMTREIISVIDSCTCDRFQAIKTAAGTAGYNPASLSSLNTYLGLTYGDTLSQKLFDGLQNCGSLADTICTTRNKKIFFWCGTEPPTCTGPETESSESFQEFDVDLVRAPEARQGLIDSLRNELITVYELEASPGGGGGDICFITCPVTVCDTIYGTYTLPEPQLLPEFLKCGYTTKKRCLTCDDLRDLTADFKAAFSSPYNGGPVFTGNDLSAEDIKKNELYARYINFKTGFHFSWLDYAKAIAAAGCSLYLGEVEEELEVNSRTGNTPSEYVASVSITFNPDFESGENDEFETFLTDSTGGGPQTVICRDTRPLNDTTGMFLIDTPCHRTYLMAVTIAQDIYNKRKEFWLAEFEKRYRAKCMDAKKDEKFSVTYLNKEYHYTLYYYDMAGSLVKTVPPKGVRPDFSPSYLAAVKADRAANISNPRPHEYITQYRYNSLGGVIAQHSPDANTSKFWYDRLGRLTVSQNAQQFIEGKYSYTLYDALGRITEVGQKPQSTPMTQTISQDDEDLFEWIVTNGGSREQITQTVYDLAYVAGMTPWLRQQQNLRNRVSYIMTRNLATDADYYTASFFTYDIHGNVDTLLQDYKGVPEMDLTSNRIKSMTYQYDLVSGKVNMVSYQPDVHDDISGLTRRSDRFYHRYRYDAENRLTEVETSRDQIFWERDAAYNYYKHGPLSRTELGQLRVQGVDYAYTLQGWLKGVNGMGEQVFLNGEDMNQDGKYGGANSVVARDVYGFGLHYFDDGNDEMDYKAISGADLFARPNNNVFKSLFNGNIAGMSIYNGGLLKGNPSTTNTNALFYNYRYDQLNRIRSMRAFTGLGDSIWTPSAIGDYAEDVTYDPNGNIERYKRNGAPSISGYPEAMDSLEYKYYSASNRLKQVRDTVASGNYSEDIDHQSNTSNYTYDAIGNLKSDIAEGVTDINWTVYGKIAYIVKGGDTIRYTYDATGNRITKKAGTKTTIYVRDASGNVMSVYEKPVAEAIVQAEVHLYGSSRLGIVTKQTVQETTVSLDENHDPAIIGTFTRGEKLFELTNHLGNVLATITDRRQQIPLCTGGDCQIHYYEADIASATDYHPFGMGMPGRKVSTKDYRYGFNGKENDQETKTQDYGMRIYDPRIGKFLSVDPLTAEYPWNSSYAFAENDVIRCIDLDGAEKLPTMDQYAYNGSWGWFDWLKAIPNAAGKVYNGLVAGTWNSGVDFFTSLGKGTLVKDLKAEGKEIVKNIKNEVTAAYNYHTTTPISQQLSDFGNYVSQPERLEDGLLYFSGTRLPIPKGKGNLLKVETKSGPLTRNAVQAEVSATVTVGEALAAKYTKNRPKHYQRNIEKVWEKAKDADGNVYDPNTGEQLTWDKFKSRYSQWHMGHKPGHEYRTLIEKLRKGEITEDQFKKEYHNPDNYQPEAPGANMSHKYEQKKEK